MLTKDFYFDLPPELIAQYPSERRGESRMLMLDCPPNGSPSTFHGNIGDIVKFIPSGTVMVINNSRVRRARLHARTVNNGSVEIVVLRRRPEGDEWEVLLNRAKRRKPGEELSLPEGMRGKVVRRLTDGTWLMRFSPVLDEEYLERNGEMPLPPYISRLHANFDYERYQTVYASEVGSAAAPTAGLHFTPQLLDQIRAVGVQVFTVTLHVGLGTFLPVRVEQIADHRMHMEDYSISEDTAAAITAAKQENRPVLAVGTTSVRALESSWDGSSLLAGSRSTDIFLYPGVSFNVVDMLLTNFHTPESTLLMLVSAFAGREQILSAYQEAIDQRYRFFSYGDAMFINRWTHPLLQNQP